MRGKHVDSSGVNVNVNVNVGSGSTRSRNRIYIPYEKEEKGPSWIWILIMLAAFWPIGALLGLRKLQCIWKKKKTADYRNYAAIIGDRCEVNVRELSAKLGKTPSLVLSDLQMMIDKGYLGSEAYLDRARGILVMDATASTFVDEEPVYEEPVREAPKKPVREAPKAPVREVRAEPIRTSENVAPADDVFREDEFEEKLREIRTLNDQIDDEGVSNRIDRIGELTASIFRVVREKPDRADEVKKFMNYYLPTTFKLLKSYALMEKQSYQGENIVASRKKIESILDTLIAAFEQQQDRLFQSEALDVDADIQVLETMMAKDGLVTPKGLDLRSMSGGK